MSGTIVFILRLLLALMLYSFLGWAVYTLWRELQNQARAVSARIVPRISLTVRARGGDPARKSFNKEEISIGRDPVCDVHLPEDTVSVRHARLRYHHSQWWLEDLNSKNGTRLNKHAINIPTVLTTGDEIGCGKSKLLVEISLDEVGLPTQRIK